MQQQAPRGAFRAALASTALTLSALALTLAPGAAPAFELRLSAEGSAYAALEPALQASAAATFEHHVYIRERGGLSHTLDFVAFGRYADGAEAVRKHADLREFSYIRATRNSELRFGMARAFWGVTEAVHIVDILNQDDALEDIDGEDKLGQPLLAGSYRLGPGRLGAVVLPRFRPREFGPGFRALSPFPIAAEQARYEDPRARKHVDYALRWTQRLGDLDLGLSWFEGTGREPVLQPCARAGSGRPGTSDTQANCDLGQAFAPPQTTPLEDAAIDLFALLGLGPSREELEQDFIEAAQADVVLIPHYDQIRQLGLEAQWLQGNAAWKFEGRLREQRGERQLAFAAGLEYSLGTFVNDLLDIGLLLEYLYDDRPADTYLTLFDDDIFIGTRILGNDVAGTQLLGGVIVDRDSRDLFWSLEASRRLGGSTRLVFETRGLEPRGDSATGQLLNDIDQARLAWELYF